MRRISVEPRLTDNEVEALVGEHLNDSHYDTLVTGDCDVDTPEGPLLRYRTNVIPPGIVKTAYPAYLKAAKSGAATNRGTALGNEYKGLRERADGVTSNTVAVTLWKHPEVKMVGSAVIGYMDRSVRWPYCRETAFNIQHPETFAQTIPYARACGQVFERTLPERWQMQMDKVRTSHPDFCVSGTPFTTFTVNRNFSTAAHYDAGDLKEGFGVISVIRAGNYEGGYLVFPRYRVAVDLDNCAVLLANVHELHGNTPIRGMRGRYNRVAIVLYYRTRIAECGSAKAELERAKRRKAGDKLYDKA